MCPWKGILTWVVLPGVIVLGMSPRTIFAQGCGAVGVIVSGGLDSFPATATVGAVCPDTCYEVCDVVLEQIGANEFHIDWFVRDLHGSGILCFAVLTPLSSEVDLGLLEPGSYTVTAFEWVTEWDAPCRDAIFVDEDIDFFDVQADCNMNGVPDIADLILGTSSDCDGDAVPDECQPDCNENEVADTCDITEGTSPDCDENGVPDDCEPDCNENGVTDRCDITAGRSSDCDFNGVPDECGPDCNDNNRLDICDIYDRTSEDRNGNRIPDECEPKIPAVSSWGSLTMALIVLVIAKIRWGDNRRPTPIDTGGRR